jgi:hypothetical protein
MTVIQPLSKKPCQPYVNLSSNLLSLRKSRDPENSEQTIWLGYGSCSVSGCPCQSYVDSYGSELCNNCGHKYTDHW